MFIITNKSNSGRVQAINMPKAERLFCVGSELRAEMPEKDVLLGWYASEERAEEVLLEVMQAYTAVYAPVLDIKLSTEELEEALAEPPVFMEGSVTQNVYATTERAVFKLPEE